MTAQSPQDIPNPLARVSEHLADLVESLARHVVAVHIGRREAVSGVCWRPGTIVTVAHALARGGDLPLTLPDGSGARAQLAGIDGTTDLAVLRLAGGNLEPAMLGDAAKVRTGHWVLAVARGSHGDVAVDHGLVGRTGARWQTWRGGRIDRFIRLDGGLAAGFSGAPIADAHGRVLGVGTSALARGYGIVIPASTVDRVAAELLANGRIARAYLGIGTQSVALASAPLADLAQRRGLEPAQGLLISSIAEGSPAEQAGWLIGDILLELAGTKVSDVDRLHVALGEQHVGATVPAAVARGGVLVEGSVTLGERPRRHC